MLSLNFLDYVWFFFFRYNVINVFGGLAAKETRLSISKASIALLYCFCFSFLFPIFSIKFWLYWIFERCNSLEPGGLYYWLIKEQALALARVFLYCVCGYYICILWCPFQECKWLLANCQICVMICFLYRSHLLWQRKCYLFNLKYFLFRQQQ